MTTSATIASNVYTINDEDIAVHNMLLLRVDNRRGDRGEMVYAYAPIGVDGAPLMGEKYWDVWQEAEAYVC